MQCVEPEQVHESICNSRAFLNKIVLDESLVDYVALNSIKYQTILYCLNLQYVCLDAYLRMYILLLLDVFTFFSMSPSPAMWLNSSCSLLSFWTEPVAVQPQILCLSVEYPSRNFLRTTHYSCHFSFIAQLFVLITIPNDMVWSFLAFSFFFIILFMNFVFLASTSNWESIKLLNWAKLNGDQTDDNRWEITNLLSCSLWSAYYLYFTVIIFYIF